MPASYEKRRDALVRRGMSYDKAQAMSAAIENAQRKKEGKPPMKPHRRRAGTAKRRRRLTRLGTLRG